MAKQASGHCPICGTPAYASWGTEIGRDGSPREAAVSRIPKYQTVTQARRAANAREIKRENARRAK